MVKLVLLILQYGGAEHTQECLMSVLPQLPDGNEIVVVDNASPNGFHELYNWLGSPTLEQITPQYLRYTESKRVHLLRTVENRGYGTGNNIGAEYAFKELCATHLWVLNNDTRLAPDAFSQMVEYLTNNSEADLIGHTLLDYGTTRVQALAGAHYNTVLGVGHRLGAGIDVSEGLPETKVIEKSLDYVTGASVIVSSRLYNQIGLFDPTLFLYFEEIDLARRATKIGISPRWAPRVLVEHKEGVSISPQAKSTTSEYHATLSSLLVTRKHYPLLLPLTMILRSLYKLPRYIISGRHSMVKAHLKAIRDFYKRMI